MKKITFSFLIAINTCVSTNVNANTGIGTFIPASGGGAVMIVIAPIGQSTSLIASQGAQTATIKTLNKGGNHVDLQISRSISKNSQVIAEQSVIFRKFLSLEIKKFNAAFHDDLVQLGLAQQKSKARYNYGEQGRTTSVCYSKELGNALKKGKATLQSSQKSSQSDLKNWSTSQVNKSNSKSTIKTVKNVIHYFKTAVKKEEVSNAVVNPVSKTLKVKDVEKVKDINKMILNPLPTQSINTALDNTEEGQKFLVAKKIKRANELLAESVKSKILASKEPTQEMTQMAKDIWDDMGQKGEPEGMVDGKLSENALLNLLVSARIGNKNWQQKAEGNMANNAWIERELLSSQAIRLSIQLEKLKYTKSMVSLLASTRMQNVSNQGVLSLLNTKAISNATE